MKIKPILFNTEMVRAILDGRKSVTRRIVKGIDGTARFIELEKNPSVVAIDKHGEEFPIEIMGLYACFESGIGCFPLVKAPYRPGDILYVRETWAAWSRTEGLVPKLYYRADGDAPDGIKWRPSIHMPKEAARLFLRVTNVRVERLQDITVEQAIAEGAKKQPCEEWVGERTECDYFANLWDSTVKKADLPLYGWAANPWVWVIEFERCERPEDAQPC